MIFKSIRGRLLLWLGFLLLCILAGFGATAYQLQRINRLAQIDDELVRRVAALSADARGNLPPGRPPNEPPSDEDFGQRPPSRPPSGPGPGNPRSRTIRLSAQTRGLFNEGETNGFYFGFWSRDQDLLKRSSNAPVALTIPERLAPQTIYRTRTRGELREAYRFTDMGECALAGRNIKADLAAMRRFALWLAMLGGAVLALGLGGAGWLVSRALRPVQKIGDIASRISAGNLSERINVTEADSELGQLAGVLNSTFARLDAAFAQQARFTADAAHELRTPVSVMLTHVQNGLASECAGDEHREAFEACQRAAQRMRRLIESLLELARLDAGQAAIVREPFDLNRVIAECVELVRPLAAERGIKIDCELSPLKFTGDSDRLAQVITNLLTNAIHYNKSSGEVRVRARSQNGAVILSVSDTGQGISAEDLPHIFERFYRADKSRSTAGKGLGLAISKAIVQAHGGSIEVCSEPGKGSEFQIILPRHSP